MRELLSDLASHVITLRTENMFKGLSKDLDPPAQAKDKFLVNTQEMLDHIKLQQSVQNATQRTQRNKGPQSKRFNNNGDTNNYAKTYSGARAPATDRLNGYKQSHNNFSGFSKDQLTQPRGSHKSQNQQKRL
ncbi:uncharacterized protein B0P05DRAFT_620416 [Gilbertella persicaria]|uniref:uncharacterized protein n=1 Tax=Gilbertella persicaria TaxID=101096 RepID=UPI00221FE26D|nr:uncharacterized protein B0P05DRAFT_620416 [Gilbertella persicaria]KAI8068104.1 hypothetical protein B0P05DRAFT_620416 [Gilbertella persicaria]